MVIKPLAGRWSPKSYFVTMLSPSHCVGAQIKVLGANQLVKRLDVIYCQTDFFFVCDSIDWIENHWHPTTIFWHVDWLKASIIEPLFISSWKTFGHKKTDFLGLRCSKVSNSLNNFEGFIFVKALLIYSPSLHSHLYGDVKFLLLG